ncbi:MAG: hypothetical protein ABWX83_00930 [Luteibacter sp.]
MKYELKNMLRGSLPAILLACALCAAPSAANAQPNWGRCIAQMRELTLQGSLGPGEEHEVFRWSTTCTSPFSSSSTGLVVVYMQRFEGGYWRTLASGFAPSVLNVGPGTYRLVAKNDLTSRTNYTVRHRRGLG